MNPRASYFAEESGGSSLAEFKMKVISEETWMNAARSGLRNPKEGASGVRVRNARLRCNSVPIEKFRRNPDERSNRKLIHYPNLS
jgi:hypothetical protein